MSYLDEILAMGGEPINPRTSPYFGSQDMGSGAGTVGSGTPLGWMQGLGSLPGAESWYTPGYGTQDPTFNREAFFDFIDQNGYQLIEQPIGGNRVRRTVLDRTGNVVLEPVEVDQNDQAFWNGGMIAMAVTGANIGLANGFFGAPAASSAAPAAASGAPAAASGGLGTLGTIAPSSAAPLPALPSAGLSPVAMPSLTAAAPAATSAWGPAQWLQGINAGLNIVGGLYGMSQADKAAQRMDPFGPYRAQYAQQLQALLGNPGSVSQLPGFRSGIKALESSTAAGGYFGSGNAAAALTEFGGNFFQQEAARLAQLAGAGATPGAGALGALDVTGRSMAGIGYGIGQLGKLLGG